MQIPFIGDIEDDSITNQEETPTGHAAARFQRGYYRYQEELSYYPQKPPN